MHPAPSLWLRHHPPAGYPRGVVEVPEPIPGLSFFPGGYGLWGAAANQPLPPFPVAGVMVLGHDFHSEAGYKKSYELGAEPETMPTWRNLIALLREAGIPLERCFFTNLYMGLRAGSATTGPFPGATDRPFVAHCQRFFLEQLAAQRPTLLLTLGIHVPPVLAELSPQLRPWSEGRGLKHLDSAGPVQPGVTFEGLADFTTTAVALTHTSLRHASVRHRRYQSLSGHAAEVQMLRDALALAGSV